MSPQPQRRLASDGGLKHFDIFVGNAEHRGRFYLIAYHAADYVVMAAAGLVHVPVDNAHVEFASKSLSAGNDGRGVVEKLDDMD